MYIYIYLYIYIYNALCRSARRWAAEGTAPCMVDTNQRKTFRFYCGEVSRNTVGLLYGYPSTQRVSNSERRSLISPPLCGSEVVGRG